MTMDFPIYIYMLIKVYTPKKNNYVDLKQEVYFQKPITWI